ncbi:MAG: Sua5/YciO/YrdC/YwlC family protein, partial [Candidatus Omnitrophota bacterium]
MKKIVIDPNNIDQALIKEAADTISGGGIVALPTETVYGLAAAFQKREAIKRLYQIKKRPPDKPF